MRILIIGSEGFIGHHIVSNLSKINEFELLTCDKKPNSRGGDSHYMICSIENDLNNIIAESKIDISLQ